MNVQRFWSAAGLLHRSAFLRSIAKRMARRLILTQPFYGGEIAFNAVTHSWAWTGGRNYENFDRDLQDRLLALSLERPLFFDIGANVGAMTLSILLRNAKARAVAVEPGSEAIALLRRSLRINALESRCLAIEAAASAGETRLHFDSSGSVMGHVAAEGEGVAAVEISEIVRRFADGSSILMKIDVEGYESVLLTVLHQIAAPSGSCAVVELHPLGFNGMGDPQRCTEILRSEAKFSVQRLGGLSLGHVDPTHFTQIEVCWL
jgi:FkbM family methyltransferase